MAYSQSESAFLLRGNRIDESAWRGAIALQGATWVANSDPFGGYALDASTGTATLPNNPRIYLGASDWTLEVWCKPTTTTVNGNYIASVGVSSNPGFASVSVFLGAGGNAALLASYDGSSWVNVSGFSGGAVPYGVWSFLEFTRRGSTLLAAINGVDVVSYGISGALQPLSPGHILLGGNALSGFGDRLFQGLLGPMRFTQGIALRGAGGPLPVPTENFPPLPPLVATVPERARIAASAPVPPHSTLSAARLLTARDMEFAGTGTASATGTIYGSTAIKGSPNAPVRAKVSLLRARDLMLVQQTWSDPATGAYAFHGLDPFEKYTTLAEYPTGDYRAVAADQLTPDIEEARAP